MVEDTSTPPSRRHTPPPPLCACVLVRSSDEGLQLADGGSAVAALGRRGQARSPTAVHSSGCSARSALRDGGDRTRTARRTGVRGSQGRRARGQRGGAESGPQAGISNGGEGSPVRRMLSRQRRTDAVGEHQRPIVDLAMLRRLLHGVRLTSHRRRAHCVQQVEPQPAYPLMRRPVALLTRPIAVPAQAAARTVLRRRLLAAVSHGPRSHVSTLLCM